MDGKLIVEVYTLGYIRGKMLSWEGSSGYMIWVSVGWETVRYACFFLYRLVKRLAWRNWILGVICEGRQ